VRRSTLRDGLLDLNDIGLPRSTATRTRRHAPPFCPGGGMPPPGQTSNTIADPTSFWIISNIQE